jgi:nicotinamide riboside transporter PnuC
MAGLHLPALEIIGWAVTALAVTGVLLNNRRHRGCFFIWMVSNAASGVLHLSAGMIALAVRDALFLILSIAGLVAWNRNP